MLKVTQDPPWVDTLDAALEPLELEILDLPVVVDAAENRLDPIAAGNLCVELYPVIRDFPYFLEVLLKRSPPESEAFFRDGVRAERRHAAMWRAMGEALGVPPECFEGYVPSNPAVNALHNYLTEIGANGPFANAVAATSYAVEGATQRIATRALEGLQHHERLGTRGRLWLEEHARYDGERPILALEIIKASLGGRVAERTDAAESARHSLELLCLALQESYHR